MVVNIYRTQPIVFFVHCICPYHYKMRTVICIVSGLIYHQYLVLTIHKKMKYPISLQQEIWYSLSYHYMHNFCIGRKAKHKSTVKFHVLHPLIYNPLSGYLFLCNPLKFKCMLRSIKKCFLANIHFSKQIHVFITHYSLVYNHPLKSATIFV